MSWFLSATTKPYSLTDLIVVVVLLWNRLLRDAGDRCRRVPMLAVQRKVSTICLVRARFTWGLLARRFKTVNAIALHIAKTHEQVATKESELKTHWLLELQV